MNKFKKGFTSFLKGRNFSSAVLFAIVLSLVVFVNVIIYTLASVFPLYKIMVKQILAASQRNCELKVIGSDKLRYAMFEDENMYKLYIFNSDFNVKQFVKVIFKGEETERVIDSVGLEIIEYKK